MPKRKQDNSSEEANKKKKQSTNWRNGKEYSFWWDERKETMSQLLTHQTLKNISIAQNAWVLKKEHKIESNTFEILQNSTRSTKKKEVKSVAKRGKKLKPNEVERARKIEVILTKEQKELFQQWCEVFCFTYNRALELFETRTFILRNQARRVENMS
jgi:hypothetical protein